MSNSDQPQIVHDNVEGQMASHQDFGQPMVDMSDPSTRSIFQQQERPNQSIVSADGQMIFSNPFKGHGMPDHCHNDQTGGSASDQNGEAPTMQQLETELQSLSLQLQQLGSELGLLMPGGSGSGGSGIGADSGETNLIGADIGLSNSAPSSTPVDSPSGSNGDSTLVAPSISGSDATGTTTTAAAGAGADVAGATTPPGAGSGSDSTGATTTASTGPGSDTATISNPVASGTPGPESAIGQDGNAVGSTATAFGPSAMPSSAESAPGFYVSATDGSATGDGTSADPFATLQQAQQAMENSTIKTTYVEGGTYNLSSTLSLTGADSGESFIADNSQGAVTLDGGNNVSDLIAVNGANNISVEGFTMQNTQQTQLFTTQDWAGQSTGGDAIWAENSTGDNFSYNAVSNVGMAFNMLGVSNSTLNGNDVSNVVQAFNMTPNAGGWSNWSDNDTISGNRIENVSNTTGTVAGFYPGAIQLLAANNDTVSNNVVENTAGAGITIADASEGAITANDDTITANTVVNTNTAALASSTWDVSGAEEAAHPYDMGAIYVAEAGSTTNQGINITDNYVKDAGQGINNNGIYLDYLTNGATVTGNIVQGNGQASDMQINGGSNNTVANNVFDLTSSSGSEGGIIYQNQGPQMVNNVIQNNIFYDGGNSGNAYNFEDNANDQPTVSGNDYSGVSSTANETNASSNSVQFVNPTGGNYSLA